MTLAVEYVMSLKSKNMPYLAAFLVAQAGAHLWMLGLMTGSVLLAAAAPDWKISATVTAIVMVVVFVLSDLLSDNAKARLVFWRWDDPLPASSAFSQHMLEDARVDPTRIKQRCGMLPHDPEQQNRLWYADIYRPNREKAGVAQSHGRYLLLRELSALTAVLAVPLAATAFTFSPLPLSWKVAYVVGLAFQYVVVSRAAANAGIRLVKNALAEACS